MYVVSSNHLTPFAALQAQNSLRAQEQRSRTSCPIPTFFIHNHPWSGPPQYHSCSASVSLILEFFEHTQLSETSAKSTARYTHDLSSTVYCSNAPPSTKASGPVEQGKCPSAVPAPAPLALSSLSRVNAAKHRTNTPQNNTPTSSSHPRQLRSSLCPVHHSRRRLG